MRFDKKLLNDAVFHQHRITPAALAEAQARLAALESTAARGSIGTAALTIESEQAELRAAVVDLVTKYEDSFPPLKASWRPVVESSAKVNLFSGAIVLSTRSDLTIGQPGGKVIIDLKTGRITAGHREDLRFYSLVETVKSRQTPRLTATFSLDSQRIDTEDVNVGTLRAAVRRLVEGAQLIDELDRQKRTPTRTPGAPCRWCPIAATCDVGTAYLNGESDDPDGF